MPSKSLYRKYRPQTFADVVGQEHIEQTLRNALANDRVAHAYLFCGPRGTGKTTTARLLAKALLCEHAPTANPCGVCDNCIDIAESTHPDVYEIDAASRTGVDNVREEIIGKIAFSPTRGRYKVYIIDEVHMLSTGAFNALLKTLEEPPDHVVFVLCTTEIQKVPQTIVSRCQRFDFHSLSTEQICTCLEGICEGEGFGYEQEAIELIAEQAKGGMRDAITALEQVAVFGNGSITFSAAQNMFGDVDTAKLSQVIDCIARRDMAGCFSWVAELSLSGIDVEQVARDLTSYVRNLYVVSVAGASTALPPMSEDEIATLERQCAELGSPDRIAGMLLTLGDLVKELRVSTDARLSLEIALTRMAHPETDLTLESLSARISALEAGAAGGIQPGPASTASTQAASGVRVGMAGQAVTDARMAQGPASTQGGAGVQASQEMAGAQMSRIGAGGGVRSAGAAAAVEALREAAGKAPGQAVHTAGTAAASHQGSEAAVAPAVQNEVSDSAARGAASPSTKERQASQPASQQAAARPAAASSQTAPAGDSPTSGQQPSHSASYLRDPGSLRRLWDAAVRSAGEEHPMIPSLMEGSKPHANLREMKITVELPPDADFALSTLSKSENMQLMRDALKRSFGTDVQLEYRLGSASKSQKASGKPSAGGSDPAAASGDAADRPAPAEQTAAREQPDARAGQAVASQPQSRAPDHQDGYDAVPLDQYEDLARYADDQPYDAYSQDGGVGDQPAGASSAGAPTEASMPQSTSDVAFAAASGQDAAVQTSAQPGGDAASQAAKQPASAASAARRAPASKPVSGDMELADMLDEIFEDGVVYRDPQDENR